MRSRYRFAPTGHAVKVFHERFCPELSTSQAKKALLLLAHAAGDKMSFKQREETIRPAAVARGRAKVRLYQVGNVVLVVKNNRIVDCVSRGWLR